MIVDGSLITEFLYTVVYIIFLPRLFKKLN